MSNLIYIRLAGGLGNQLFQVAAAELFAQHDFQIVLMTGALSKYDSPRNFDLDRLLNLSALNISIDGSSAFLKLLSERVRLGRFPIVGINDRNITNIDIPRKLNFFMDGYFQDFWDDEAIKKSFGDLANHIIFKSIPEDKGVCVVHIRGGDFLKSSTFNIVPISWYVTQAKVFLRNYGVNKFCIVSDDARVAELLSTELESNYRLPVLVKVGRDLLEDFHTVRTASYRLLGNSTFALSAAASAGNHGVTVAPKDFDRNRPRNWRLITEINNFIDVNDR